MHKLNDTSSEYSDSLGFYPYNPEKHDRCMAKKQGFALSWAFSHVTLRIYP